MERILKIQVLVSATIVLCSGIEASAAGICADIAIFNKTIHNSLSLEVLMGLGIVLRSSADHNGRPESDDKF